MLACGWINQSICRRGSRWDGPSWSSVSLAGFSLLHLLANPVFCILLQCDFIWKLHMQWDITLFQVKLDCSCIGSVVKLHLGDNSKYFPDFWVCILFFSAVWMCAGMPKHVALKSCCNSVAELPPADVSPITCTPFLVSVLVGLTVMQSQPLESKGSAGCTCAADWDSLCSFINTPAPLLIHLCLFKNHRLVWCLDKTESCFLMVSSSMTSQTNAVRHMW